MFIVFFILLAVIIVLIIPIKLKTHLNYDFTENSGLVQIKFYKINVLFYRIKYDNKKLILKNKNETRTIDIEINPENVDFANELQKQIFKRVFLKELNVYIKYGIKNNSMMVALISGIIRIIQSVISNFVAMNKPTAQLKMNVEPIYVENSKVFSIETTFSISITNILISFVQTKYKIKSKELKKSYGKEIHASD